MGVEVRLAFDINPQPNDTTCGPTCLHAVYRFYDDLVPLAQVVEEVPALEHGGTLGVLLANHALRRGYRARIYTYNLQLFDPTWFQLEGAALNQRLRDQRAAKRGMWLHTSTDAYLEFLERGGEVRAEDLTGRILRRYLAAGRPILTGLSATYLYRSPREIPATSQPDDVRGEPAGHFVVLCGYDQQTRQALVADPLHPNPFAPTQFYEVGFDRLIGAILLGIVTYDANLLIIEPRGATAEAP